MLIDTHAHLDDKQFRRDLPEVVRRAEAEGVSNIITVGDSIISSHHVAELSMTYKDIFAAIGVHPHNAKSFSPAIEHELRRLAHQHHKVVAIGEIGIDFHYNNSPRRIQEKAFWQQLALAKSLKLPVSIHCRNAYAELIETLSEKEFAGLKGVVHCLSSTLDQARQINDLGFYIGITGIVTFKKSEDLPIIVNALSLGSMLIETDSPYLAPTPFRGNRNEPSYLKLTMKRIAELKELPFTEAAAITRNNAIDLFSLPLGKAPVPQFTYAIKNTCYINLTNRCANECNYCKRTSDYTIRGYNLKIEREPTSQEVINQIGFPSRYDEVVFCGYGEPTYRAEVISDVAKWLKENGAKRVRLNTNGLGDLINQCKILPDLADSIDAVSISLNATDKKTYDKVCAPNPEFKDAAFDAVIKFIKSAKKAIGDVTITFVDLPEISVEKCETFVKKKFDLPVRIRPLKQ